MDDISIIIANLNKILVDDNYIFDYYYSNKSFNSNYIISSINFYQFETIFKENRIISEYESLIITKLDILQIKQLLINYNIK